MKAISRQSHAKLTQSLTELCELLEKIEEQLPFELLNETPPKDVRESLNVLNEIYERYQRQLSDLAKTITEYDRNYYHVRSHVLAPYVRALKKHAASIGENDNQLTISIW